MVHRAVVFIDFAFGNRCPFFLHRRAYPRILSNMSRTNDRQRDVPGMDWMGSIRWAQNANPILILLEYMLNQCSGKSFLATPLLVPSGLS